MEQRRPSGKIRWQNEPIPPQLVTDHEYHEISDEENLVAESPRFEVSITFIKLYYLNNNIIT